MKISLDLEADVFYVRLEENRPTALSREVEPGVILDYNADGAIVGIEILNVSSRATPEQLEQLYKAAS
jgi:uncharacterized protein YuzE